MRRFGIRVLTAILLAACVLFCAQPSLAGELTISLTVRDSAFADDGGKGYILDLESLSPLSGKRIVYAQLALGAHSTSCSDSAGGLLLWPLAQPWTVGASSSPAVSLNTETTVVPIKGMVSIALPRSEAKDPTVVATELVQAWVDGQIPNWGLFVTTSYESCVWSVARVTSVSASGEGVLSVRYIEKEP